MYSIPLGETLRWKTSFVDQRSIWLRPLGYMDEGDNGRLSMYSVCWYESIKAYVGDLSVFLLRQTTSFQHTRTHMLTWMPSSSLLMHQKLSASMFLRASSWRLDTSKFSTSSSRGEKGEQRE